jgi:hypothetical protein
VSYKLDIEKLHRDIELDNRGELIGRGVGKTTVMIERLIGAALVSTPCSSFVVLCHNSAWVKHLWTKVMDQFWDTNYIARTSVGDIILNNGTHIMFCSPDDVFNRTRGARIFDYFIDDYDVFLRIHPSTAEEIIALLTARTIP